MNEKVGKHAGTATLLVFVITTATIAGAWGFQLIGGYIPCPLCLEQRWPYYIVIPLALLILLLSRTGGTSWLVRGGLVACGLVMLVSAGLGGHHAGVEWGWWPGPASCLGGAGLGSDSVLPDLNNLSVVRCDEVQWRFAGLSFAGWNFVISLLAATIAIHGTRKA